jgi:hypothetical protein
MPDRSRKLTFLARRRRVFAAMLFIIPLAACSGIKTYPNNLEKNLQVRTNTNSGSIFSRVRASLNISRVDGHCQTHYEGTVKLAKGAAEVGVPVERWSYLVFDFSSSGLLSTSSTMGHATLLKPRAGYRYDVDVTYRDHIYNVVIRESRTGTNQRREVDLRRLDTCERA